MLAGSVSRFPNRQRPREGVHAPARVEHRELVGVVGRPCAQELRHQRRLAAERAPRKHDGAALPAHDAGVHEGPASRPRGHAQPQVGLEGLEDRVEIQAARAPAGPPIEQVVAAHVAARASADPQREQLIDDRRRRGRPAGRQVRGKLPQDLGRVGADADPHAVGAEARARRPPEAVDLRQSGGGLLVEARHPPRQPGHPSLHSRPSLAESRGPAGSELRIRRGPRMLATAAGPVSRSSRLGSAPALSPASPRRLPNPRPCSPSSQRRAHRRRRRAHGHRGLIRIVRGFRPGLASPGSRRGSRLPLLDRPGLRRTPASTGSGPAGGRNPARRRISYLFPGE